MTDVYLVSGVRTPQGKYGGALSGVRPDDLAALVVAEAVRRAGVPGDAVDEVVLGAANQAGEDNRDVARMAVLLAGLPSTVPGYTVNRLCASGLTAVANAAQSIRAGEADVVVAGGIESMTRAPWVMAKPGTPWAKPGEVADTSLGWRFTNPRFRDLDEAAPPVHTETAGPVTLSMGETAEEVAALDGITRAECDEFAVRSHARASAAAKDGRFDAELVAVTVPQRRSRSAGATRWSSPPTRARAPTRRPGRWAGCGRSSAPTVWSPRATPHRCRTGRPRWSSRASGPCGSTG